MIGSAYLVASLFVLLCAGIAGAQEHPLMNMIADRVIQKYQQVQARTPVGDLVDITSTETLAISVDVPKKWGNECDALGQGWHEWVTD